MFISARQCSGATPISCAINGTVTCCPVSYSNPSKYTQCIDGGADKRSHCPVPTRCCIIDSKPKCCPAHSDCSANYQVLTAPTGNISSPNFPDKYPSDIKKIWKIEAPKGQRITLQFRNFNIEGSSGCSGGSCSCDYVKISNECIGVIPELTRCGSSSHREMFVSSGNELWIEFKTDGTVEYTGFQITYAMGKKMNLIPKFL